MLRGRRLTIPTGTISARLMDGEGNTTNTTDGAARIREEMWLGKGVRGSKLVVHLRRRIGNTQSDQGRVKM